MTQNITYNESFCKPEISCHGMASASMFRDMADMERRRLKEARKRAKLTQEAIAASMGVSVPQISRWETGKDGIPSQRLAALSEAYQAKISELFDIDEIPSLAGWKTGITERAAKLAVLFVANRFAGHVVGQDDPLVAELAPLLRAFVELASDPRAKENDAQLEGFLQGISARLPT